MLVRLRLGSFAQILERCLEWSDLVALARYLVVHRLPIRETSTMIFITKRFKKHAFPILRSPQVIIFLIKVLMNNPYIPKIRLTLFHNSMINR